jgi:hypothetical protein
MDVTLIPLVLQLGLRIGPIQRMGAAPGVIHTGRFFVLIQNVGQMDISLPWIDAAFT